MKPASVYDYRDLAKRRLPKFLFEYIDGGSYDEITLNQNRADLGHIALRQRVARDVSTIDLSTELFGHTYAMPVALAPVGIAGMNARRHVPDGPDASWGDWRGHPRQCGRNQQYEE